MDNITVLVMAIIVSFLWGVTPVIHKHVLIDLDPRTVMVLTSVFYFACLMVFWWWNHRAIARDSKNIRFHHLFWIAIASIFTAFIANIIYLYVLKKKDSYVVSALVYSCPLFTLILASLFLKEHITWMGCIGVFLITLGVVCIALSEKKDEFVDFKTT